MMIVSVSVSVLRRRNKMHPLDALLHGMIDQREHDRAQWHKAAVSKSKSCLNSNAGGQDAVRREVSVSVNVTTEGENTTNPVLGDDGKKKLGLVVDTAADEDDDGDDGEEELIWDDTAVGVPLRGVLSVLDEIGFRKASAAAVQSIATAATKY
jgi:hypothetical protein